MFKVPEWEEDVPKKDITFAKKVKKIKSLETKPLINNFQLNSNNQTTDNLSRLKANKKKRRPKKKQILELSVNRNNEKSTPELDVISSIGKDVSNQQINNNSNNISTKQSKKERIRNKNKFVNGNTRATEKQYAIQNDKEGTTITSDPSQGKRGQMNGKESVSKKHKSDSIKQNIEDDTDYKNLDSEKPGEMLHTKMKKKLSNIITSEPSQDKQRQMNGKESVSKKRKHDSIQHEIEYDTDYEHLDSDKPDEMLLNMKKKKLSEALKNDDREDLLFSKEQTKSPKKKKVVLNKEDSLFSEEQTKSPKKKKVVLNKEDSLFSEEQTNNKEKKVSNENGQSMTSPVLREMKTVVDLKKKENRKLLETANNSDVIRNPIKTSNNKLRERMLKRLKAAQFRYLNERLYTSSGSDAKQLFQNDPNAFQTYHQGYQLQVKKWPVNPLDVMVKKISKMPRNYLIADMGCGEAALSKRIPHTVRSFDLVATVPGVEVCDMAHTPLLSSSVDVAVYCLSLMGTDLTQYIIEANRVLKIGGQLLIAEVESRFDDVDKFIHDVQRLGFKLKNLDKTHKLFFFMDFRKIQDPSAKKAKRQILTLKPCLYKRR